MYAIGDTEWPGLSKLIEEAGELIQVSGKLMGSRGATNHWSGDLKAKFIEECGDVMAAIAFFMEKNFTDEDGERVVDQMELKFRTYEDWHKTDPALPEA